MRQQRVRVRAIAGAVRAAEEACAAGDVAAAAEAFEVAELLAEGLAADGGDPDGVA